MVPVSAVIITYNEEHHIGRCLESLAGVADEVVVVDSGSEDRTVEICTAAGARVAHRPFAGHVAQKNYAVQLATYERVLSLDADEALSDRLRCSILAARSDWRADAWECNRRTNYCGRWIRHGGWYPDRKVRLWDRRLGRFGGLDPHDRVELAAGARLARLDGDLLHYSYRSQRQHLAQMNAFSTIAAEAAYRGGRRAHLLRDLVLNPWLTFLKKYLLQAGFRDGEAGLHIAVHAAYGKFLKYAKLRELARRPAAGKEPPAC